MYRHACKTQACNNVDESAPELSRTDWFNASMVQLLERGVRTATALLAAAGADTRWGAAAGAGVDEAAAAAARDRAVAFAASAAAAAAMLLQRLQVRHRGCANWTASPVPQNRSIALARQSCGPAAHLWAAVK